MKRVRRVGSVESVGSNHVGGEGEEVDAEFDTAVALLLVTNGGAESRRSLVDPWLDVVDCALGEEGTDGCAAFAMDLVFHGAKGYEGMVR